MSDLQPAVVVDDWALVRLGVTCALESLGVQVAGESGSGRDGLRLAQRQRAGLMVVGSHTDLPARETARRARQLTPPPKVVVLATRPHRDELAGLLDAGVDALLLRSMGTVELGVALERLAAGERVVAPALLPALLGGLDVAEGGGNGGEARGRHPHLTGKEREVLAGLAGGYSNRRIAEQLCVTPATVKTHLAHIYRKLGAADRHEALHRALALGLLT